MFYYSPVNIKTYKDLLTERITFTLKIDNVKSKPKITRWAHNPEAKLKGINNPYGLTKGQNAQN